MDIPNSIRKSFEKTIEKKYLWIYGYILFVLSLKPNAKVGNGNWEFPKNMPQDIENTTKVLGASTTYLLSLIVSVSPWVWLFLGLSVIFLILFITTLVTVVFSWAKASLVIGLRESKGNKDIQTSSKIGREKIKIYIKYNVVLSLVVLGSILALIVFILFPYFFLSTTSEIQKVWLGISTIGGIIAGIVWLGFLSITAFFAERLVLLKNYSPSKALKKGFKLAKKNAFKTLKLGFVIGLLSVLINGVVISFYATISFIPLAFVSFFVLSSFIHALFTVWKEGLWNLFFESIERQEKL